jgi:hypothetical protein
MTQLTKWEEGIQQIVELAEIQADIFLAQIAIKNDGDGRLDAINVLKTLRQRRYVIKSNQ